MAKIEIEADEETLNYLVMALGYLANDCKTHWQDEAGKKANRISSGLYGIHDQLVKQGFYGEVI